VVGVPARPFAGAMRSTVARVSGQLTHAEEATIRAPNTLREFFYRVWQTEGGRALLFQTQSDSPEARIAALIRDVLGGGVDDADTIAMARSIGMSRATFFRYFKAATGHAPKTYFRTIRLMRAKTMLTFENASVAEAAFANGFGSASHFSHAFRAHFGAPPASIRDAPIPNDNAEVQR